MPLWTQLQYLSLDARKQIFDYYKTKNFPTEVRHHLAVWIENNIVPCQYSPTNPSDEPLIRNLCEEFIDEVARAAQVVQSDHDFLQSFKLHGAIEHFKTVSPLELYQTVKDCIAEEMRLLQFETKPQLDTCGQTSVAQKVCIIANRRLEFAAKIDTLMSKQAELRLKREERQTKIMYHNQLVNESQMNGRIALGNQVATQIMNLEKIIDAKIQEVYQCDLECAQQAESVTGELDELVTKIFEELMPVLKWSSWGLNDEVQPLDNIQRWYTDLIDTILEFYNLIMRGQEDVDINVNSPLRNQSPAILQKLGALNQLLMSNVLVVEQQPNQVIKKETKFTASVRFLGGEKFLPRHIPPEVRAVVINEEQARKLHETKSLDSITPKAANAPVGCGKVINDKGSKNSRASCNRAVHSFNNMAIKEVRRLGRDKDKRATANRAMTEKFCLVFYTELKIYEQTFKIWCCSIPFVFIVHVNQKLEGWATIFWDNSFRESNRIPFSVPDEVPWSKMSVALNKFFQQMTETTRDLTLTNLSLLAEKLYGHPDIRDDYVVSRRKFSEKDGNTEKTFWEWFYDIVDLVNKHLKEYWNKGYIIGFIQRPRAEDLLASFKEDGAFLLRFSDSMLGAVSLSYTFKKPNNEIQVLSVNPFNDAELKKLSLADRLSGSNYQNVYYHAVTHGRQELCRKPKLEAFPPKPRNVRRDSGSGAVRLDYVPAQVVMIINPNEALPVTHEMPKSPGYCRENSESGYSEPPTPSAMENALDDLALNLDMDQDFIEWINGEGEQMDYDGVTRL